MLHAQEPQGNAPNPKRPYVRQMLRYGLGALCGLVLFATGVAAQGAHSVTLGWSDALNPAGTTYSVYRATGLCSGTPTFSKLASGIATKTYQDTTVTPGNFCYTVSATVNGVESAQSASVNPAVPAFAPTALSFTVQ